MIRLPATGSGSLNLVTAQNGASVVVSYSDATSADYSGNTQAISIISATTTTICSAPAAGAIRDIDEINIKNTYAGSHTVTVQYNVSSTNYPIITAALLQDESLNYTHGSGWQCKDANGNTKNSPLTAMTSAQLAALLSDETGTGLSVFNTSPTFVTSVIGSASMDVFNTVSTTINAFGAATSLSIGAATGTLTLNNAAVKFSAGTVSAPSLYWGADTGTGLYRIGSNNIGFAVSGSKVLDIGSTAFGVVGLFDLSNASSGQIKFPATQHASADAHTLDDYQEDVAWTPVLTFNTPGDLNVVYSSQIGRYTKIGNLVTATFYIATSTFTFTTASGAFRIAGLPFTAKSGIDNFGPVVIQGFTTSRTSFMCELNGGTINMYLNFSGSGLSTISPDTTNCTSGTNIIVSGKITFSV